MLKKLLNPFNVEITKAGKLFVWTGMLTSIFLHGAFYYAVFHFIQKVW